MKAQHIGYLAALVAGSVILGLMGSVPGMRAVYIGYLAASVCMCLPFIYWITAPDWWRSRTGRALMMLLGSLGTLFAWLVAARIFVPDRSTREAISYVIFSLLLVAGMRLAVLFFQLRFGADWAKRRVEKP